MASTQQPTTSSTNGVETVRNGISDYALSDQEEEEQRDEAMEDAVDEDLGDSGTPASTPAKVSPADVSEARFLTEMQSLSELSSAHTKEKTAAAFDAAYAAVVAKLQLKSTPKCTQILPRTGRVCARPLLTAVSRQRGSCAQCTRAANHYWHAEMVAARKDCKAQRDKRDAARRTKSRTRKITYMRAAASE